MWGNCICKARSLRDKTLTNLFRISEHMARMHKQIAHKQMNTSSKSMKRPSSYLHYSSVRFNHQEQLAEEFGGVCTVFCNFL